MELSLLIPEADAQLVALTQAINCAILAPAGTLRSRALAALYRDDRTRYAMHACMHARDGTHVHRRLEVHPLLACACLGRLITPEQARMFAGSLPEHLLATTADGPCMHACIFVAHV